MVLILPHNVCFIRIFINTKSIHSYRDSLFICDISDFKPIDYNNGDARVLLERLTAFDKTEYFSLNMQLNMSLCG